MKSKSHKRLATMCGCLTSYLEVVGRPDGNPPDGDRRRSLREQVLDLLAQTKVLTRAKLRDALAVNNYRLSQVLELLEHAGQLRRRPDGWRGRDGTRETEVPFRVPYIYMGTKRSLLVLSSFEQDKTMPGIDFNRLRAEITMELVLRLTNFQPVDRRGHQPGKNKES